jgi:protein-disulfide isomerase
MTFNIRNLFIVLIGFLFIASSSKASVLDISKDDLIIGDSSAPITIIEYSSLSCIHCANFHNNTLPYLKEEYVDTGKVRFVFRDFPLNLPALVGSMLLRCVPDIVKYDYMNAFFLLRKNWVVNDNAKSRSELYKIMQTGGMTQEKFDQCIDNDELGNQILQGRIDVQAEFKIQSTPSFIINGVLIGGDKTIKEFRQIIDKILSE